jgi:DNA replication protein DnaC
VCEYNENCLNGWINLGGFKIEKCECIRDKKIEHFYKWSEAEPKHFKRLNELRDQLVVTGKGKEVGYKRVIETLTGSRENIKHLVEEEFRLVLSGSNGSGKTQMAVTIAIEILANFELNSFDDHPRKFYFLPASKIKYIMFDDEKIKKIQDKIHKSDVLILDDLGVESLNMNGQTIHIYDCLNNLIRSFNGFLIITTNEDRDLREVYRINKRLASVLIQGSKEEHGDINNLFYEITTPEGSERRKKKNKNVTFL